MSFSTATNRVQRNENFPSNAVFGGYTVNSAIPVAEAAAWKRQAFQKIIACRSIPDNWDGRNSSPVGMTPTQTAIELVRCVPGDSLPVPLVAPVSGGGIHMEWQVGDRELEVAISPSGEIETLRVLDGVPIDEERIPTIDALFGWLGAR